MRDEIHSPPYVLLSAKLSAYFHYNALTAAEQGNTVVKIKNRKTSLIPAVTFLY